MKIVTWNVNSLGARWPRVANWIREHEPDVLMVQETKQDDQRFPYAELAELGYESAHLGHGQWNGVAIISRVGLSDVAYGLDGDDEARHIAATCAGVRVHCCYVPNGRALDDPHYAYKLRWLASLRDTLASRPLTERTVVVGDFNIAPSPKDVYDETALAGATHVSAPERDALRAVLDLGFIDVGETRGSDDARFTWWDYRQNSFARNNGMRIDLVLVDQATSAVVTDYEVDLVERRGEKPSDHAPVVVTLDL